AGYGRTRVSRPRRTNDGMARRYYDRDRDAPRARRPAAWRDPDTDARARSVIISYAGCGMRHTWQLYALVALVIGAGIAAALAPAITRDASFHLYADQRGWLGIPNAGDVLSNLPFVLVGVAGLVGFGATGGNTAARRSPLAIALFVSLVGVGFGSGAYHAAPGDPA